LPAENVRVGNFFMVEMIKEGRTSVSIAAILGYSESLIRQETIIIYRKLGISGRNELKDQVNSDWN
jgi:DNA-binding CsgD family transcriptional regulator